MGKFGNIPSGIHTPERKITHFSIGKYLLCKENNSTDSSSASLRTETRKIYKHLLPDFQ